MTMLNVYDRSTRKKTAVLQNAFNIVETQEINQIYSLSFTLPYDDEKNKFCLPRHFIRYGDTGELYRIKAPVVSENNTSTVTYECEHVITTLCDDIMFGSFVYGGRGVYTTATINWLLNQQKTKNWRLGTCAFSRQFEYNWEQENILNALYSIPKEFAANYIWVFDTINYPWTISLKAIDKTATPEYYLRAKSNILASGTSADYANICTRIYPLGYGEGVNQLTIKDATVTNVVKSGNVNINGEVSETSTTKYNNTYIQSPQAYIDKYGIVEKVLVDRRFEQANSLFGYAKQMLEVYQEPTMSRSFDVTDLYPITNKPLDDAQVGKICKMTGDGTVAYITRTQRRLDVAGDLQIDLSTKASDIASNVADLADRIRIESVYAQGATQLYQHSKDANAAAQKGKGMVLPLYFPAEMKQINKVLLKLELKCFRAYSQTAAAGGGIDKDTGEYTQNNIDTEPGGAITDKDTELGGGVTDKSTQSGGGVTNKSTQSGGGVTNKSTQSGGGVTDKSTNSAGGISTQSGQSGGGTGTTGVAYGGSNLSLSVGAVTVNVGNTDQAHWYYPSRGFALKTDVTKYNDPDDPDSPTMITKDAGAHGHDISGHVDTVEPLESQSYKHTHYNDIDGTLVADSVRDHFHGITDNGHDHIIDFSDLQHYHSGSGSVTVDIKNSTPGQSGFSHSHSFSYPGHTHTITIAGHTHTFSLSGHTHTFSLSGHTHTFSLSGHRHTFSLSGHRHKFSLGTHRHTIKVDPHTHTITPGIYEFGNPTKFDIYVGNDIRATVNAKSYDGDITQWLLNNQNLVPRNQWINVEIVPNDLAYVQASVFVQGFVQSRGGGNY